MRYYPAFDVKSGPDALFRRFLSVSRLAPEHFWRFLGTALPLMSHL
jgi:hypothetical protein